MRSVVTRWSDNNSVFHWFTTCHVVPVSGSGIRFARYAGACPRWNVFSAFMTPGMIKTQVSEFEDGSRSFCVSTTIRKVSQGYTQRHALHAIGLGCEVAHARKLVYADGVALDHVVPVGVTCRLCNRGDCSERAHPSHRTPLSVDDNVRASSFSPSVLPVVGCALRGLRCRGMSSSKPGVMR